jgi:hypothetical protein
MFFWSRMDRPTGMFLVSCPSRPMHRRHPATLRSIVVRCCQRLLKMGHGHRVKTGQVAGAEPWAVAVSSRHDRRSVAGAKSCGVEAPAPHADGGGSCCRGC